MKIEHVDRIPPYVSFDPSLKAEKYRQFYRKHRKLLMTMDPDELLTYMKIKYSELREPYSKTEETTMEIRHTTEVPPSMKVGQALSNTTKQLRDAMLRMQRGDIIQIQQGDTPEERAKYVKSFASRAKNLRVRLSGTYKIHQRGDALFIHKTE